MSQLVKSWSDMRLTDERERRKAKKAREEQKRIKEEKRLKAIRRVKVTLVILVIASIFIGGFILVYSKRQKEQELVELDRLRVEFADLSGLVEVTPQDTGATQKFTSTTQDLTGAGRVETGADGRAVFSFSDGLVITLFPDSVFEIKTLQIGSANTIYNESVLAQGACVVKGSPIPSALKLETPSAVITSQGRDFARFKVEVKAGSERVASDKALLKIQGTKNSGRQPSTMMLKPLHQIRITRKGLSEPVRFNPLSEAWQ